jgi:hypothetical protein
MVAEYRQTHSSARPTRHSRAKQTAPVHMSYTPDASALCVAIRRLWSKERRLGSYAPTEELSLDLETLDTETLQALRAQVRTRIATHTPAAHTDIALGG